ncbi:hypothetical protein WJX74_008122 [Apatococcus lobatus]|uniref:PSI-G n=1 Tax=Apatococcus lobatus TaxID=904363 RepID=A0AAW1S3X1_9CHLO
MATTMSLTKTTLPRQSALGARSLPALSVRTQSRRSQRQVTRAINDTNLIISGCTAGALILGRFVFLPFQKDNLKRQGLPVQNDVPYADIERLSQQADSVLKTNDPEGFNIIDVLAWGSLGHAAAYAILAINSLQAANNIGPENIPGVGQ